ncbi:MAG TPA: hypothetical protein ENK72_02015 [Epsilonproteobacteria bacterium]|nr:hypothetical protein [Campylobacterota bacterium]
MAEEDYRNKGRLSNQTGAVDHYRRILDNDRFEPSEPHWRRISKNTITLFQVLIDQDLKDLVSVLEHYPKYTEWVCEHFRYAYSYSENSADISAAGKLLTLGEPYFSKQFVRNLVRKLPSMDNYTLEEVQAFVETLKEKQRHWHPIIVNHYCEAVNEFTQKQRLHPLQKIVLTKGLNEIKIEETYDYSAEDRDAVLDIPYMN